MTVESKLFLISAASGTGKSSLINSAMTELENTGKKVELSIYSFACLILEDNI